MPGGSRNPPKQHAVSPAGHALGPAAGRPDLGGYGARNFGSRSSLRRCSGELNCECFSSSLGGGAASRNRVASGFGAPALWMGGRDRRGTSLAGLPWAPEPCALPDWAGTTPASPSGHSSIRFLLCFSRFPIAQPPPLRRRAAKHRRYRPVVKIAARGTFLTAARPHSPQIKWACGPILITDAGRVRFDSRSEGQSVQGDSGRQAGRCYAVG